jgi:uncharacterized protein (TIGR02391 family)
VTNSRKARKERRRDKARRSVERQDVLNEVAIKSFEVVRLSRVKYVGNSYDFIDVRAFQRGWRGDMEELYPTTRGVQLREDLFSDLVGLHFVPRRLLHPLVREKAWPCFKRGEYDQAVFQAFKQVEIRVREAAGLPADVVGTDLMRKAFATKGGPLTLATEPTAEKEALSHLFAGSMGRYKNPLSHRDVPSEATETVALLLLASHLLRVVDSRDVPDEPGA